MHRSQRTALGVLVLLAVPACRDKSCLDGVCKLPCDAIQFTCPLVPTFYVGPVGRAPAAMRLTYGAGGDDDILISNGRVTAVINAIDAPIDLAPTGGDLIDLGPAGGVDDTTITYQLAGILPDDAFAYRTLEYGPSADGVQITVRGSLDGRPDVKVVTHYELRGCDPGVRVHSELFNGSTDTEAFMIADAMHWGKRRVVPFAPAAGQGYAQPELKLLELSSQWAPFDFVAGNAPTNDGAGYAALACNQDQLYGVNDLEISALGTPIEYVAPGDSLVLERMLLATGTGEGTARATDAVALARAQAFGVANETITGRIVAGGMPFGGDVRRASIVIRQGDRALASVVPAADGTFAANVLATGDVTADVWSFGRKVTERSGTELGDIEVPEPARVELSVDRIVGTQREAAWAMVAFAPDDDATRAAVTGTFHGRLAECAPWLGPPNGPSPACNRVIVEPQGTEVEVPAGKYVVIAAAGPEHTIDIEHVQLAPGEIVPVAIDVEKLDLVPPGWISADLHVHGRASFDSGLPDEDRVKTFVASGVQVIAATDHDVIGDYTETVAALHLDDRVAVMGGLETTQLIPWMDVPGESVPRVIGHFNFWPLVRVPSAPRAGAPWDELIEPGALFDRMQPLVGDDGMMMLNHPWSGALNGRHQGYLNAIKFDPRVPIGPGSRLLERPAGQHRNLDWSIIEIINGGDMTELMQARPLWHSLLAQGYIVPGAGNSDSHGITDDALGWARNWVQADTQVIGFDAHTFDAALRDGRMIAGNGVVVLVEVGPPNGPRRGLGFTPYHPQPGDVIAITVKAAPWVPVQEVRIVTSKGTQVIAQVPRPANPFGTDVIRYKGQLPIASLVAADDFLIVEAGMAYPLAADLDNDGVLDTTDNNGDGVVDQDDVAKDEDTGPLQPPADPTDPGDIRFLITQLVRGAWPEGFANPIFVDLDGNGWTPPGVGR
jgi:hypothetical protein